MVTPVLREMKGMVIEMTEQQKKKPNVVFMTRDFGLWDVMEMRRFGRRIWIGWQKGEYGSITFIVCRRFALQPEHLC